MSKTNPEQSTEGPAPEPMSSSLKRRTEDISVLVGTVPPVLPHYRSPARAAERPGRGPVGGDRLPARPPGQAQPAPSHARPARHLSLAERSCGRAMDGGAPLTLEEFWTLEAGEPDRVIETHERLSGIDSVRRNGSELLREARELVAKRTSRAATAGEQL